jgi:hypothetical protein
MLEASKLVAVVGVSCTAVDLLDTQTLHCGRELLYNTHSSNITATYTTLTHQQYYLITTNTTLIHNQYYITTTYTTLT